MGFERFPAIDGFRIDPAETSPGTLKSVVLHGLNDPDFIGLDKGISDPASGEVVALTAINGALVRSTYPAAQAIDAVTAVLMADSIDNEFSLDPDTGAQSEWVVTQPTRPYYTDPAIVDLTMAIPPYTAPFSWPPAFGIQPEDFVDVTEYDRDGNTYSCIGITPCTELGQPEFPTAVQSILFVQGALGNLQESPIFGSPLWSIVIAADRGGVINGRLHIALDNNQTRQMRPSIEGHAAFGLPVLGFASVNYVNDNAQPGLLANYSGAVADRMHRSCALTGTTQSCSN